MEAKEILKKLVSFNTIRDNQNKEIMDFIENYLKGFGFETKRIKKCLIAYNDVAPNIGFLGHTDTVDYESWDGDPFELKEDGDKLTGLGACDMKGGLAAMLSAVSNIDLTKNKLALYFTNDEEINFEGIKDIRDEIVPNNIIIGEPTDNIPIYGMIIYLIDNKKENYSRYACGGYYKFEFDNSVLLPHPYQESICW